MIEDEPEIRRFVRMALQSEGLEVFEAETLQRGLIDAATRRPELVVLDLGLPDGDGLDFIREFRGWSQAPVLVLSAREGEGRKVQALDAGADDYLVKPFGVAELLARVRVQLRRHGAGKDADPVLRFGLIAVDRALRTVTRDGEELHLTPIEYRLLQELATVPGRVLTHQHLLKTVWGPGHAEDVHYVRVHMANLRKKIEADPNRPQWLVTEAGVGYRLKA
ncbi:MULTISPECIES: response regulator [unclassified Roseateles]|uniref:response regulator n=1 Tax=unclassified Roseateles TaxID=2626991 RepID=UPI0006F78AB4|nr:MULTISPECIES: response regulator [unclassified Roseateles]KQW42187.1 two-component system response regulator [Pelomonas sp. Root405]KRA68060.1 two-component system response regulator [Pelomonas sp. Root662]